MKMQILKRLITSFTLIVLVGGCAALGLGKQPLEVGQTVRLACGKHPLHTQPTGYSSYEKVLKFGAKGKVLALAGPTRSDGQKAWVKVEVNQSAGGYLTNRCLVSEKLFKKQEPAKAQIKAKQNATVAKTSKGFSEDEEGGMVAMGGAAGKAKGGKANYPKIDKILKQAENFHPGQSLISFRRGGLLGEFAK